MNSFKNLLDFNTCGNFTWKDTVDNWTWVYEVRLLTRDLGDIGVNVSADSKEVKTEKKR